MLSTTPRRMHMKNLKLGSTVVLVAILFCTVLIAPVPTPARAQSSSGKVLLIPREGYSQDLDLAISKEIGVMTKLLTDAGFTVDIATSSGSSLIGPTRKIENVKRLAEVNTDVYVGVILPCMAVGLFPGPPVAPEAVMAVQKIEGSGKPVAAALGSVNVLAEAGVLKGRKYSYSRDPLKPDAVSMRTDARFADALYVSPGVTQDGGIITCGVCPVIEKVYNWGMDPFGTPSAAVKLTEMFIAAIGSKWRWSPGDELP
jgi:putative intracellular protease/amidase